MHRDSSTLDTDTKNRKQRNLLLEIIMGKHDVVVFKPYPFKVGEKLNIEDGPRRGDWEVIGISEHKVKLRCPVSFREFEWSRFCYFVEDRKGAIWPQ